jgi:hypothetical protein
MGMCTRFSALRFFSRRVEDIPIDGRGFNAAKLLDSTYAWLGNDR